MEQSCEYYVGNIRTKIDEKLKLGWLVKYLVEYGQGILVIFERPNNG